MFEVKMHTIDTYNTRVSVRCLYCNVPIVKAFWKDTPQRHLYDRCLMCSKPIPAYESLIRNQHARIFMHLNKKVPVNGAQGLLG